MKISIIVIASILLVAALFISRIPNNQKLISAASVRTAENITNTIPIEESVVINPVVDPTLDLQKYVLDAMFKWAKIDSMAPATRHSEIARDIVWVVTEPNESPLWDDDISKAKTSILLASIAFFESRYRDYVSSGNCNDYEWRQSTEGRKLLSLGDCDGGLARSIFQLHMGIGIVLVDGGGWKYSSSGKEEGVVTPQEVISDTKKAVRVALHMSRKSIRAGAGLCWYSGEGADGNGCPKANIRLNFAKSYSAKNPF